MLLYRERYVLHVDTGGEKSRGREREIDLYAEAYTYTYRHTGLESHTKYTQANTEMHRDSHPYRLTKIQTQKLVQMCADTYIQMYTYAHIPHDCTNRHRDPQTHLKKPRDTQVHKYACLLACAHRHGRAESSTPSQTHACAVTCVYSHVCMQT